jgi:hypothetical protein
MTNSYSYIVRRGAFAQAIEACEQLIRDYEAHKGPDGVVNGLDFNMLEIEAVKTAIVRIQCAEARNAAPQDTAGQTARGSHGREERSGTPAVAASRSATNSQEPI